LKRWFYERARLHGAIHPRKEKKGFRLLRFADLNRTYEMLQQTIPTEYDC
jgi:hypothetical protein